MMGLLWRTLTVVNIACAWVMADLHDPAWPVGALAALICNVTANCVERRAEDHE